MIIQPLFDGNASCHIALGNAYTAGLQDGDSMTHEDRDAVGINSSFVHYDLMIDRLGRLEYQGRMSGRNACADF
ncbi:aminopeptidase [Domibacillus mangrovi]|uniref:Uncharacterized protein n=1 Tax=Domibacillus mangrovi TaxID=1714354 RepID=A0A1Q5P6W4_9BACI|nr:aminopeptidase [Domibacillus mangrovi]OKL37832.1 hypothetical protein BLL40_03120 [Domibacillus mangrovi]